MDRQELKGKLSEILNKYIKTRTSFGTIAIGIITPELPHLEAFADDVEEATNVAREINEVFGFSTNVRLASHSGIMYAKFPKKGV